MSITLAVEEIKSRLAQPARLSRTRILDQAVFDQPSTKAAVLIPFYQSNGPRSPWHIILTRRTDSVGDHKGQVAFPGGHYEPGDDFPVGTALREAQEEVGISPGDVEILGQLQPLVTITNYQITPVIGRIPWPYTFTPQPQEVGRVFNIPLDWLAEPEHCEVRSRKVLFPRFSQPVELEVIYFTPFDNEILWGISAEITLLLLEKLKGAASIPQV